MKGYKEEKQSNEIKFFIPALEQMEIAGRTVPSDAMNTQVESANHMVERGGHFHFTVKGNQPKLLEAVQTWHELEVKGKNLKPGFVEPAEKDHGRITQRRMWMTEKLNGYVEFPHVKQVFVVERIVKDPKGKDPDRCEFAYGITSLSADEATAEEVLCANRGNIGLSRLRTMYSTTTMRSMKMPLRSAVDIVSAMSWTT